MFEKYCQLRQLGCNHKISSNLNNLRLCNIFKLYTLVFIYILYGIIYIKPMKQNLDKNTEYIPIVTVISVPFSSYILTLDLQTIKVYFTSKTKQDKTLRLKCSIYFYIT